MCLINEADIFSIPLLVLRICAYVESHTYFFNHVSAAKFVIYRLKNYTSLLPTSIATGTYNFYKLRPYIHRDMSHDRQLDEIQDAKKTHFMKILKNVLIFIHFYLLDRS